MPLGMDVGLSPGDFVLDGDTVPLPKKGAETPKFVAHVYGGQTAGWIKMPLGMKVGLSPGDSVLDGDPDPSPQKGVEPSPQFSAHFYCAQTAGCVKMPLGMAVGLSPGDFVLDGDPAPFPKRRRSPAIFGPCLLWPNGWMDQDSTWHGGRPWSSPHCARYGHSSPPQEGSRAPSQFSAHLYCGQTAGCIKMSLGMDVGFSPSDFVLDGDPAAYPKSGGAPLNFRPTSIVAKQLHRSRCHLVRR